MAQLLGYVNMKVMAVRLMLTKKRYSKAQHQLMQIEEASQELFVDVRQAILGLRMNGGNDLGLANTIQEYSNRFSRLSEIKVDVKVDPEAEEIRLDAETELQLLRIVQEALTNIRKHASAENVWVNLEIEHENLAVTVGDDGIGFNPNNDHNSKQPHFGLGTMRERAESIGADFTVNSELGSGTRIEVMINKDGT
jgi:signal transduction histidine kinase